MRAIRKQQLDFLNWEMGAFFHFGIRTFYEGHKDWDMQEMPASGFNPINLDCEQWIATAKEAGCKYAILVCKHHDGFANWPSAYTEYSVKNTPWKDGKGDVVQEFTDACRKYDLKVGLYYSPAQFGSEQQVQKDYDDYFINQLSELLQNYGKVDYLWFDGCGSENHTYDAVRIVNEIRRMQPDIMIFNMWDPDTRWVGNEEGYASFDNRNVTSSLEISVRTDETTGIEERFLPAECDFRMREKNWFYSDFDEDTIKSVDTLMGIYYSSVGRGANFLINIAPNRQGLLPEKDCARLLEFGKALQERFANPIDAKIRREGNTYFVEYAEPVLVNHAVLSENLENGENIEGCSVSAKVAAYLNAIQVAETKAVGHKRIITFPTTRAHWLEITIEESAPAVLDGIQTYYIQ